jgi:hypothetical protein
MNLSPSEVKDCVKNNFNNNGRLKPVIGAFIGSRSCGVNNWDIIAEFKAVLEKLRMNDHRSPHNESENCEFVKPKQCRNSAPAPAPAAP